MPTPNDYTDFQFGRNNSAERQQSNLGTGGDYGQTANAPTTEVSADQYPNVFNYGHDTGNTQFSRDKTSDPQAMADEASGSAAYDLIQYFNTSPYTPGSRVCHELNEKQTPAHPSGEKAGPGDGRTGPDGGE